MLKSVDLFYLFNIFPLISTTKPIECNRFGISGTLLIIDYELFVKRIIVTIKLGHFGCGEVRKYVNNFNFFGFRLDPHFLLMFQFLLFLLSVIYKFQFYFWLPLLCRCYCHAGEIDRGLQFFEDFLALGKGNAAEIYVVSFLTYSF